MHHNVTSRSHVCA